MSVQRIVVCDVCGAVGKPFPMDEYQGTTKSRRALRRNGWKSYLIIGTRMKVDRCSGCAQKPSELLIEVQP